MTDTIRAAGDAPARCLVTGPHTVFEGRFQRLSLVGPVLPNLVFTDPPGLDDDASFGEVAAYFTDFFEHLEHKVAAACALFLVPRDRKGHPFQKSVIVAYCAQSFGWQVFRQFTWINNAQGFHRARYASQPIWALRRGNMPARENTELRYKDVIYARDLHASGGMVMAIPDDVVVPCLELFQREGSFALDPFAGSGSVMKAAQHLGMTSLSVEVDPVRAHELAGMAFAWGGVLTA